MNSLTQCLVVGVAGFFGAVARLLVGKLCGQLAATAFPLGTLIINITGSFALGWFVTFASTRAGISENLRLAIAVGFLGAFTTFSTWMYESSRQVSDGATLQAGVNLIGSVVLGYLAIQLGIWMASR